MTDTAAGMHAVGLVKNEFAPTYPNSVCWIQSVWTLTVASGRPSGASCAVLGSVSEAVRPRSWGSTLIGATTLMCGFAAGGAMSIPNAAGEPAGGSML